MHVPKLQASMAKYKASELIKKRDQNGDGFFIHVPRRSTQLNNQGRMPNNPKANEDVVDPKLCSNAHVEPNEHLGGKYQRSLTRGIDIMTPKMPFSRLQLKEIFMHHDSDNDGFLNVRDLTKAFAFLGSIIPFNKAHYGLVYADANKDGLISEAELDKLIDYAIRVMNNK